MILMNIPYVVTSDFHSKSLNLYDDLQETVPMCHFPVNDVVQSIGLK